MIIHELKIEQIHLAGILKGDKMFEIRKNDRFYHVGDIISFLPSASEIIDADKIKKPIPKYAITSIYYWGGSQDGYVVLGIKKAMSYNISCTQL